MKTLTTASLALVLALCAVTGAKAQRYRGDDRYRDDRWNNRISFEVVRSREVVRPCADVCGFRRFEGANPAVYRVETRVYTEFYRNRVLRTWTENVDVFVHCLDRRERRDW